MGAVEEARPVLWSDTRAVRRFYGQSGNLDVLYAISDSDWAADVESRKSTSCGSLDGRWGSAGASTLEGQTTIAQSSGEAEFYGAASRDQ